MNLIDRVLNSAVSIDPSSIVKEAYDKDFRWWFLVLLVMVLGAGLWALRYLINQSEVQRKAHTEHVHALVSELSNSRKHHHDRMEGMQVEAFRMAREVVAVVTANNIAIESSTRESEKVRQAVERWESRQRDQRDRDKDRQT